MLIKLIPRDEEAEEILLAPASESRGTDGAGDVSVDGAAVHQPIELFRAAAVQIEPRGNFQTTATFRATRLHADTDASAMFCWLHQTEVVGVPGSILVKSSADATTGALLENASVLSARSQQIGRTTVTVYQVAGGAVVAWTAP